MITRLLQNKRLTSVFFDARTVAAISSNQDNWSLGAGATFNLQATLAGLEVSGLADGQEGRWITLVNVGSYSISFLDESSSSTAARRIVTGGDTVVLRPNQGIDLQYNNALQRWVVMHSLFDVYDPVTDPLLICLTGSDGIRRVSKQAATSFNRKAYARLTSGDVSQGWGAVSGLRASFELIKAGDINIRVCGNVTGTTVLPVWEMGYAIDGGTAQRLVAENLQIGAGADTFNSGHSAAEDYVTGLAIGSHYVDFYFGSATVNLEANTTRPAVIVVDYEG